MSTLEIIIDLVRWVIPSGAAGAVVTYFVTRRSRNNDFLEKLQHSIDLLTEKYTQVLDENTKLMEENKRLKSDKDDLVNSQRKLTKKVEDLTKEVARLNETITEITVKNNSNVKTP
jgi:prefoldin subunit 5